MVTYIDSLKTGNWSAGSTWSSGQEPQTGEHARINSTHTVTYDASVAAACGGFYMSGGALVLNKDMPLTDASTTQIYIDSSPENSITSNGTAASPRKIYNVNGSIFTNPIPWLIEDIAGTDARTLNLDYVILENLKYYIGNETYYIYFNGGGSTDPMVLDVIPLIRDVLMDEHAILGREKGRCYYRGMSCGSITISGKCHVNNFLETQIKAIIAANLSISLITDRGYIKKGRIDRYRVSSNKGGMWKPFSITVREEE